MTKEKRRCATIPVVLLDEQPNFVLAVYFRSDDASPEHRCRSIAVEAELYVV